MQHDIVLLNHGSGCGLTRDLIDQVFGRHFGNPILDVKGDSAILPPSRGRLAFTTDSYVVKPLFFPGGDIGKLAVCGTVNDLAVSGATPCHLSASFIIEEGFPMADLERIVRSMAAAAKEAGVAIVTGDTKVVNRGAAEGLFITTAGIGEVDDCHAAIVGAGLVAPGDRVIVTGEIGEHALTVLSMRNQLPVTHALRSDCAPLAGMLAAVLNTAGDAVHFMRDATRGGLGGVLCELAGSRGLDLTIEESLLPVGAPVAALCNILGFDPLFLANEGKAVIVCAPERAAAVIETLREHQYGRRAAIVGTVSDLHDGSVAMRTSVGGTRVISMPAGDQIPRIC